MESLSVETLHLVAEFVGVPDEALDLTALPRFRQLHALAHASRRMAEWFLRWMYEECPQAFHP